MTDRGAARRYARAVFDVAMADRADLETIAGELEDMAALLRDNEPLQRVLSTPAVPAVRKRAVIEQILLRSPVTPVVARVLLLLADRDRLVLVADLAETYRSLLLEFQNIVRAEVTTAFALAPERVSALQQGLARATGRHVELEVRVDPSLVGGAVARIGSTVYDGSVTMQLEKLKQQLVGAEI